MTAPAVPVPAIATRGSVIVSASGLVKEFPVGRGVGRRGGLLRALDGVSLELDIGQTLGVVGESGSGKSTLARLLMGLERPTRGSIHVAGLDIVAGDARARRGARRIMQMVFQDPYSSLDPRMTVYQIVSEPWIIHRSSAPPDRRAVAADLLRRVGMDPLEMDRLASSFSGGQRQRVGIARALALSPKVLILDEPVSALDVSIQAQIIELLRQLQETMGLSLIFIAHDLAVVRSLAHRVAVMYLGRIVETGLADAIYREAAHPYTRALLSAVPSITKASGRARLKLAGEVPSPIDPPSGCRFHTRCWLRERLGSPEICVTTDPPMAPAPAGQLAACHFLDVATRTLT